MSKPASSEEAKSILRRLFLLANGDAADAIRKYQGNKLPGFGIMYPELKKFAEQFEPSTELALELIDKNTREARIVGLLLSKPEELNKDELSKIDENCVSEELQNLFARHIVSSIIDNYALKELENVLSGKILIKAMVQRYRMEKRPGDYDDAIHLLAGQISNTEINITDGQNITEMLYREYPNNRVSLKKQLHKLIEEHPAFQLQIREWISTLEYIAD